MDIILLTKSTTPVIGQIAVVMGWIMSGIYNVLNGLFGIQNLGLCIIIFSIIIYALMTPLQIKQQKFSKLSNVMQPEIQKIQKKYQGKKDQESMQKMQEETQMVYQKYGVSMTGSCVQLAIQLPILWALWQVIYRIPAYVSSVKDIFSGLADNIASVSGYTDLIQTFITDNKMSRVSLVLQDSKATVNSVIDFLYALSPSQWKELAGMSQFSAYSDQITSAASKISKMQNFCGLNIADQPMTYISDVTKGGSVILCIAAIMIPFLAWLTQYLNYKLIPQTGSANDENSAMNSSMKTMNTVMPVMSAVFCFTFPIGLGLYWIASAVVRSIQQIIINHQLDKIDIDVLVNENMKKIEEKRAKQGLPPQKITNQANQTTRNIKPTAKIDKGKSGGDENSKVKKVEKSYENARNAKPGSITAKANMVRDFDERNKKK